MVSPEQSDKQNLKANPDEPLTGPVKSGGVSLTSPQNKRKTIFKEKYFIWLAVLLVLVFSGAVWYIVAVSGINQRDSDSTIQVKSTVPQKLAGVVNYLQGEAYVLKEGRNVELKLGDSLKEGDLVETKAASRLTILLDDGSTLRLDENGQIVLASLASRDIEITNLGGNLYSRVNKDLKNKYSVMAGGLEVESVGTVFAVSFPAESQAEVLVFESEVKIKEAGKEAVITEGFKYDQENKETVEISQEEVKSDEFIQWNFEMDKTEEHLVYSEEVSPTPQPTATIQPTAVLKPDQLSLTSVPINSGTGIRLEGDAQMNGIRLRWSLNGLEAPNGFKVIKGTEVNPVYPGSTGIYQSAGIREYVWSLTDGKTYHFRVCIFENGACQNYSNDITVTAPLTSDSSSASSASINTSVQNLGGGQARVSWIISDSNPIGFKIVWSRNSGPVYPPRTNDQDWWAYVAGGVREHTVSGLSGTYYFRVCKYDAGCQFYSNEISLSF